MPKAGLASSAPFSMCWERFGGYAIRRGRLFPLAGPVGRVQALPGKWPLNLLGKVLPLHSFNRAFVTNFSGIQKYLELISKSMSKFACRTAFGAY